MPYEGPDKPVEVKGLLNAERLSRSKTSALSRGANGRKPAAMRPILD
jgi:hypothetical protein